MFGFDERSAWSDVILGVPKQGFTEQTVPDKERFGASLTATLTDYLMNEKITGNKEKVAEYARHLAKNLFQRVSEMTATPATREAYRLAKIDKIFEPKGRHISQNTYDAAKKLVLEAWVDACAAQRDHEELSGSQSQGPSQSR